MRRSYAHRTAAAVWLIVESLRRVGWRGLPSRLARRESRNYGSTRDATRLLKRYLARHLHRVMQRAAPAMT